MGLLDFSSWQPPSPPPSSPSPAPPTGSLLADSEGQGCARVTVPSLDVLPDYLFVQLVLFPLKFVSMVFVDWAKNLLFSVDWGKTTDYFLELLQTRGITSCSNIYRTFLLEANLRYTTIQILRRFDVELQNYTEIRRRAKFQKQKDTEANLRYTTIMLLFKWKCQM